MASMSQTLPHARDMSASGFKLDIGDPNDRGCKMAKASSRPLTLIQGGLLHNWSADAVNAMKRPSKALEGWEQVVWNNDDVRFMAQVTSCTSPEDVEAIIPAKWLPHLTDRQIDERLARMCDLCTALVNRFLAYEEGGANAPKDTAQWREHEALRALVEHVTQLLEASIGDAIGPAALRDPAFLRRCWHLLCEEEQAVMERLVEDTASVASTSVASSYYSSNRR